MTKKPLKLHWQLDDILKINEFDDLANQVEMDINKLNKWYKKLNPKIAEADFLSYLKFSIESEERLTRLVDLPELMEAVDESNTQAKTIKSKAKDLAVRYSDETRKLNQWLKGFELAGKDRLDEQNAKRLFAVWPKLTYALNYMRESAKYTLDEAKESIISNKDANGISVVVNLRDAIAVDLTFEYKLPGKKAQIITNQEELSSKFYDVDPKVREAAYKALLNTYQQSATKFFTAYGAVVKDWGYEARLRGYKSPIAMRNLANHVSDKAVDVLMGVCFDNKSIYQEFFRYKARLLGMDKLRRYDLYAPIDQPASKIELADAIDLVLDTFSKFSPHFVHHAKQIITDKHIDSHPAPKKRSGAFCATVTSDITPYILLNYIGTARDVSTLAHELGHGVHSLYASHLPSAVAHATLPLAETASTLAEMMLFERLLSEADNDKQRQAMILEKLGDSYATVMRQNYFVSVEIAAHERMSKGLSQEEMGELWLNSLHDQFGDSVTIDPLFAYEWAYIPHIIHSPFYCYAYNFGELLSLALYSRYKSEGKSFVTSIEEILTSGGSDDPSKVLSKVGIDIHDGKFWQGSFDIIKGWMSELKLLS